MSRTPRTGILAVLARDRHRSIRPDHHADRVAAPRRAALAALAALGVVVAVVLVACEPPTGNTFPIPRPHSYTLSNSWHACRDGCTRRHKGSDIFAPQGTPLVAVERGVIATVDNTDNGNGGLSLWLRGDSGVTYYYAHNVVNLVTAGQRVTTGQRVARVGRTGNASTTSPHLHFQINTCGDLDSEEPCTVDPRPYLLTWPQGG